MNAKRTHRFLSFVILLFLGLFLAASIPVSAAPSKVISKGNTTEKVVALTFDDGAGGRNVPSILRTLSAHNVKATFFLTGAGGTKYGNNIRAIANQGHQIANHSYTHPQFTKISAAKMKSELQQTENLIRQFTGKTTKPNFRPPYGAYNSTVLRHVGDAGYTHTIMWSIDTSDWTGNSSNAIVQRVINGISPGAIVLMHTGGGATGTPNALPTMITRLKKMGYRFVTISQLLNQKPSTGGQSGGGSGTGSGGGGTSAGQTIRYTVRRGDTLFKISRRYGVTVQQLVRANGIKNPNLIRVNRRLIIP